MIKTSIIIPVFNRYVLTKACIVDLLNLDETHEIIIVDNGSTDGTVGHIEKILDADTRLDRPEFRIVGLGENKGFAYAVNYGYSIARGDDIIFLNNDIRVVKRKNDWTSILIEQLDENTLTSPTGGLITQNNFVYETNNPKEKWNYLSGWLLCGKRVVFDKFCDEDHPEDKPFPLFMKTYFEDTYLSLRARKMGIKMHLTEVPVIHIKRQTAKTMNMPVMYQSARKLFIEACKKEGLQQ